MGCFSRCCCCVNLRTGGLMMGVMTLALSVFSIIPMSISLVNRDYLAKVTVHMLDKFGRGNTNNTSAMDPLSYWDFWGTVTDIVEEDKAERYLPPDTDPQVERMRSVMLVFFIICIILLVVYLVFSLLLMYGSVKGNRWLLLPWIVATLLFIISYIVSVSLSAILLGVSVLSLTFMVIAIVESIVALYLWMCVISLFQFLANRNNANQAWELNPRYNNSYKGVSQEER